DDTKLWEYDATPLTTINGISYMLGNNQNNQRVWEAIQILTGHILWISPIPVPYEITLSPEEAQSCTIITAILACDAFTQMSISPRDILLALNTNDGHEK